MNNLVRIVKYNLKIIFGNKFIYFLGASVLFYLLITGIAMFSDSTIEISSAYYQLIFPGILLIFFPTTFGIQNDEDARILEILFGIPNYRYKVWLIRLLIIFIMVYFMILLFALLDSFILVQIPVLDVSFHLIFVIIFFGTLGFLFSTIVKNGNGSAVLMVIVGLGLWFLHAILGTSKWNIFINPFDLPDGVSEMIYSTIIFQNKLIVISASIVAILWGLINLQRRERFIK